MYSKNWESHVRRYKMIYSRAALILGISAMVGGVWLGSFDYQPQGAGWLRTIFGCAIFMNGNNMAPGFFLFVSGLLVIILTQYKLETNREPKDDLVGETHIYKLLYSIVGLVAGFLSMVFGIISSEIGGNGCVPDWANTFANYENINIFYAGVVFFAVGIIIVIATRYRVRIYKGFGEGKN
jgi:hypothetical protein